MSTTNLTDYQELFFAQKLDHFDPSSTATFQHRYLISQRFFDGRGRLSKGCKGPILLYTGNEGDITEYWGANGFMIDELAPEWGALLLFPEQRYYGKTLPFRTPKAEQLRFLTTAQVLEDYVDVVAHVKTHIVGAAECPVVAFGGSYGGTLTALLRASHPTTVIGGLAASSELGYYDSGRWKQHGVTEFTFDDVVLRDYTAIHSDCVTGIHAVSAALEAAEKEALVAQLHLCDPSALGPSNSALFTYTLENLCQLDYPYAIPPMPARPVTEACRIVMEAVTADSQANLVAAAAKVVGLFFGHGRSCIRAYGVAGPGNIPGDGPGLGSWGYQSCTETLHPFSARGLRNYTFDYNASRNLCAALYDRTVVPDLEKLAVDYGGFQLADGTAGVSHLIWSQGTLDPWHGWFSNITKPVQGSEVYHFIMEGAAHHLDLKGGNVADPPAVTAARGEYKKIIRKWILGYARRRGFGGAEV